MMWTHYCPVERAEIDLADGQVCYHCGLAEQPAGQQLERLRTCREDLLIERLNAARMGQTARQHRALSALIGLIGVLWSASGLLALDTLPAWQAAAIAHVGADTWLAIMFCVGILQAIGCRTRRWRHIGFVLGFVVWASVFGMFLISTVFTPVMAAPLMLALFCGGAYWDEVFSRIKYAVGAAHVFFAQ